VGAVGATSEGGIATALWTITRERQAVHSCLLTHQAYGRQGSAYRNRRRVACVKAWCRIPWHHVDAADGSTQSWHSAHVKFSPSLNTTLPRPHDGCLPLRLAQRTCSCPRTLPTTCTRTKSTPDSASSPAAAVPASATASASLSRFPGSDPRHADNSYLPTYPATHISRPQPYPRIRFTQLCLAACSNPS
jgi:hypothetical protein